MTPKENTSDLSVSLPLDAYSGAKYLRAYRETGRSVIQAPFFWASFVSPNARLPSARHGAYPKVPMTRVETCVLVSVVSLASPKSATWDVTVRTSYKFTPVIRSIFFCLFSQTRTLASKFSSKRMLTALISRWMILG